MRTSHTLLCLLFFIVPFFDATAQCSSGRYYDKIFTQSSSTVTYGNAMKFDSSFTDLKMDIYQPNGDNAPRRPLIILAFGGSFTAGFRFSPDIVYLCQEFSKRGYVCASIDYRLGFEGGSDSDTNQFKALMRGVQDMKAAVRYFYKDSRAFNDYKIDTNQIYIGGVSAGAFIGLNYAYGKQDTLSRTDPPWARPALAALGGPEGNSGNPGYGTKVKGVIDLCGAIADTVWMMPNDPIMVGVHGTADPIVACYYDSVYALTHPESLLFGGGDIKNRINHIGLNNSFYLFEGAEHVPFILPCLSPTAPGCKEYMDTTVWLIRDFLYQNGDCGTLASIKNIGPVPSVSVYPNPSEDVINITASGDEDLTVEVFSVEGKLMARKTIYVNSTQTISKQELGAGIFQLSVVNMREPGLRKTERIIFY